MIKISFFTTCGNRLQHLKQTLPKNIESNIKYTDCEHILLDYGSSDGLTDWVVDNLAEHIKSNRLIVYRYEAPFFWHNHAKNLAAKCTSKDADVICSIDADNYTAESKEGESLASYLNMIFEQYADGEEKMFVRACGWDYVKHSWENEQYIANQNKFNSASGKLAFLRKDFFELRGFNEKLKGHYYDEEEIWRRAEICWGWTKEQLPEEYSQCINHSNLLRLNNLDPAIINADKLLDDEFLEFSTNDYMDDDLALPVYPQAAKNKKIFHNVLTKKVKVPNPKKWGVGRVKRIKL